MGDPHKRGYLVEEFSKHVVFKACAGLRCDVGRVWDIRRVIVDDLQTWTPWAAETLRGIFVFHENAHWAVRVGARVCLVPLDAEGHLRMLRPMPGQEVEVMHILDRDRISHFLVSRH